MAAITDSPMVISLLANFFMTWNLSDKIYIKREKNTMEKQESNKNLYFSDNDK